MKKLTLLLLLALSFALFSCGGGGGGGGGTTSYSLVGSWENTSSSGTVDRRYVTYLSDGTATVDYRNGLIIDFTWTLNGSTLRESAAGISVVSTISWTNNSNFRATSANGSWSGFTRR